MVGISFKKKSLSVVHLESYTSYKDYLETHKIRVPIDSFICYSIQKFVNSHYVAIKFIPIRTEPEKQKPSVILVEDGGEKFNFLINDYDIPWTVALCEYPVVMVEDVIITGLCAVARHICLFRHSHLLKQEHEDGLLGFRHTCLQAPNEVSVWTKFCEIEIIRVVQEILTGNDIKEVPEPLVRFEDHMRQPVRIHNVYKVARNLKKERLSAAKGATCEHPIHRQVVIPNIEPETVVCGLTFSAFNVAAEEAEKKAKYMQEKKAIQQENTGTTEQIVKPISKLTINDGQQANAEQTDQKAEQQATAEQKVKSILETNAQKQVNTEQAEQITKQQKNAEQKVKCELELMHETNDEQEESAELQENAEKTERRSKSKHRKSTDIDSEEDSSSTKRISKTRKWKSQKKKDIMIDCSTRIEDLEVNHEFAEGPFLTLADLVLLPSYHIIIQSIGEAQFESLLPFTYKWYKNLISINYIQETLMYFMSQFNLKQLPINELTIPKADDVSLYKCDPKRHNPKKRIYTNSDDIEKALSSITEGLEVPMLDNDYQSTFRWQDIPEPANPFAGYLPDTRVQRKSEQLQNLALPVMKMATDGDVIVDFCCGTGHLGILLAYLLPRCTIILLENKIESLCRAKERVLKMKLKNVYYYQCNLDFFTGEFDIGIGLHACGIATDLILDKCLKQNAKFVLSPCCYGAIHGTCRMEYPRSKKFADVPFDDYLFIAHGADQTHKEHPLAVRGARCMAIIDSDRARLAEEFGYTVTLMTLKPVTCTPKNNLLIGIPKEK
ncbi:hypothetical protein PYW07_005041 [Mythimna separata]|uniref:Methyltransferase domain-containing protein n=1 Tax=Mythimna separata TaxID=271217 RepID=A0AAD7YDN0_MYTSE|nr:hypothetical protein PYW07_005041 [Mythimna separata]